MKKTFSSGISCLVESTVHEIRVKYVGFSVCQIPSSAKIYTNFHTWNSPAPIWGGEGRRIAQLAQRTKICKERKKPAKNRSKSNLYISVISFNFRCNKQERSLRSVALMLVVLYVSELDFKVI